MTRSDVKRFAKLLFEIIQFVRKHGGNGDTYLLNKLTECRDELFRAYPNDQLENNF